MDIFDNTTRPIMCISNSSDVFDGRNSHLLKVGCIYNLDDVEVHSWHTYVYLKEFPNVHFNSVLFEEIESEVQGE